MVSTVLAWAGQEPSLSARHRGHEDQSVAVSRTEDVVELRGIVRSVTSRDGQIVFTIDGAAGAVPVRLPWLSGAPSSAKFDEYIDTEVWLRSRRLPVARRGDQRLRYHLVVEAASDFQVLSRPLDIWSSPAQPFDRLSRSATTASRRVRVEGAVVYRESPRSLYVTDGERGLRVGVREAPALTPGDLVSIAGFPEISNGGARLADALVRPIGRGAPPPPELVTATRALDPRYDSALVRLEGTVVRQFLDQDTHEFVLRSGPVVFEAELPADKVSGSPPQLTEGTLVELTGIVDVRGGPVQPASLDILLRSPDDLLVLQAPPWWTASRVAAVVFALIALLVGAGGWIVALRVRLPRTERALRDSQERYEVVFEHELVGHFVADPGGTLLACNRAFARALGWGTIEAAKGTSLIDHGIDPGDLERWAGEGAEQHTGHSLSVRCTDGSTLPVIAAATGRYADGRLQDIHGIILDVTAQKQAEALVRQRDHELQQSQKMEAIGRLAGGVAHDFNNLLTAIIGFTEIAAAEVPDGTRQHLEEVQQAARSAAGLTGQLLAFSRKQVLTPVVLDPKAVVSGLHQLLQRLVGEDITVDVRLDVRDQFILVDRTQFEQVIINLVANARDAMPGGGTLRIELIAEANRVKLRVQDSGSGIDPAVLPYIFEPFFTTKEKGRGTGLGLATVYGIVTQSGGEISVSNAPGQGTAFLVEFPCVAPPAEPAEPAAQAGPVSSIAAETVLVVEDDRAVRALAESVLVRQGYRVIVCEDAASAERTARSLRAIDLLLTDVILPGPTGFDLARSLHVSRPDLNVLFMTGYIGHTALEGRAAPPGARFLWKPFTGQELLAAVRSALERQIHAA
jgi:PAS domain S-box-containing protein